MILFIKSENVHGQFMGKLHMEFLEACSYSSVKFTFGYSRDVNPLPPGIWYTSHMII